MNFLGNSNRLLLVYRNMPQQAFSETVNIMLPPQFYTLKREALPVKYAFQAKKIAPSLFDGLLEHPEKYDYMVYKEADRWVFIAYDLSAISLFLKSKGIPTTQVAKVFFAQQSCPSFENPVLLGEKDALLAIDGTVVNVPQTALPEGLSPVSFDDSFTPKQGLTLHSASSALFTRKQAFGLAAFFILFSFTFFVEGWRYGSASQTLQDEINGLLEEYPALQSQYKRQSIAQKYRQIDKDERAKREYIKTVGEMIFKGVKIESFKMDNKGFSVRFLCSDAKVTRRLQELAKKEGFTQVKTLTGNVVSIEEKR